jgi:hypothetical protein
MTNRPGTCILLVFVLSIFASSFLFGIDITSPEDFDMKFDGIRARLVSLDNFDYQAGVNEKHNNIILLRSRASAHLRLNDLMMTFVQFQDVRYFAKDPVSKDELLINSLDMHTFYLRYSPVFKEEWTVNIGRQKISVGNGRLLGSNEWLNVPQVFDCIKADYERGALKLNMLVAQPVVSSSNTFDSADSDNTLLAVYGNFERNENRFINFYGFYRNAPDVVFGPNAGSGDLGEVTLGVSLEQRQDLGWGYNVEYAIQSGTFGSGDIKASMFNQDITYTFDIEWYPSIGFEYNYASGDGVSAETRRFTFDSLFPDTGEHYGRMNLFSLQNLKHANIKLNLKPEDEIFVKLNYHQFNLSQTSDSLYDATKTAVRTLPAPGGSDKVGNEFDIVVDYKLSEVVNLQGGYSHFLPADYLKNAAFPTVSALNCAYFQVQINFK